MKVRHHQTIKACKAALCSTCARLLALCIAFLYSVLRTDWLRLLGSPSMAAGVLLVIPATWLAIREHCSGARPFGAERRSQARLQASAS